MSHKTIRWTATLQPGWDWASSGSNHPATLPRHITGTVTLPANNPDYWYPCIVSILSNRTALGYFAVRCFKVGVSDRVQVRLAVPGPWDRAYEGPAGSTESAVSNGGLALRATMEAAASP